jgi:hypothetical protein
MANGIQFPVDTFSRPVRDLESVAPIWMRLDYESPPVNYIEATLTLNARDPERFDGDHSSVAVNASASGSWQGGHPPVPVENFLRLVELYQLDKLIMERPAYSPLPEPILGTRGEHLAAVLDAMQGERREHFQAIEDGLRQFIPGLQRVRLRRVQIPLSHNQQTIGHQVVLDFEFARSINADQASEGTILLLGLLTVIGVEPGPPMTVMLDDLDRGLHPKAQKQLVGYLHELIGTRPELQIIATSHSPYLIEHLAYEEVLAMTQSLEDGRSVIAPLASHPEADRWRDEMSPGEFWSSMGEDWLRETQP